MDRFFQVLFVSLLVGRDSILINGFDNFFLNLEPGSDITKSRPDYI